MQLTIQTLDSGGQPYLDRGFGTIYFLIKQGRQVIPMRTLRIASAPLIDLICRGPSEEQNVVELEHQMRELADVFTLTRLKVNHVVIQRVPGVTHEPVSPHIIASAIFAAYFGFEDQTI